MVKRNTKPINLQVTPEVADALREHAKHKKTTIREVFEAAVRAAIPVKKARPRN